MQLQKVYSKCCRFSKLSFLKFLNFFMIWKYCWSIFISLQNNNASTINVIFRIFYFQKIIGKGLRSFKFNGKFIDLQDLSHYFFSYWICWKLRFQAAGCICFCNESYQDYFNYIASCLFSFVSFTIWYNIALQFGKCHFQHLISRSSLVQFVINLFGVV